MYTIGHANRCTHRGPLFDNSTTAHEPTVESLDRSDQKVLSVFEAFGADNTDKTLRILSGACSNPPEISRAAKSSCWTKPQSTRGRRTAARRLVAPTTTRTAPPRRPRICLPALHLRHGTIVERCSREKPMFSGPSAKTLFHRI